MQANAKGTARQALADPRAYELGSLNQPQREALIRFWEDWQEELKGIKLLDPACGSGAFLIEAFEQLHAAYQASNDRLEELRGQRSLFDLDRQILQHNLYGVDLNGEAVEIGRLSLWIKTAQHGKPLTSLDHTIRVGNSVVADASVHPRAFDWQEAFPEVFERGGFDVVVGNPPYVRQEWIAPYKPYLKAHFRTYDSTADLYVYFYELGVNLLRPGGRLSFVVTNKWLKAGYGEPLRRFLSEQAWVESVVDFGHAKQIFEEADVFPSIIVVRKPDDGPRPPEVRICSIPREQLRISDLSVQIETEGVAALPDQLGAEAWTLEPKGVATLLALIRQRGTPLAEFAGVKPLSGIKTGLNEAFLVDDVTKKRLIQADPRCAEIIKPFLRGQDITRWQPEWAGLWMIALKSSNDHAWPWSGAGERAESVFQETYPSIHAHLKPLEQQLVKRQDKGRYWWELRSCAYWDRFEKPKICYQEIQFYPAYCIDRDARHGNNKMLFLPCEDLYLLSVLNSPLMWWFNWRYLPHMKDEALSPAGFKMESLPIARPSDEVRRRIEEAAGRLIDIEQSLKQTREDLLDWLRVEHQIENPTMRLKAVLSLDSDGLVEEVSKIRGKKSPLSLAGLRSLRDEHARTIVPAQSLTAEALGLERQVSDLVNQAYGLEPADVKLMWETAPPRMPISATET